MNQYVLHYVALIFQWCIFVDQAHGVVTFKTTV